MIIHWADRIKAAKAMGAPYVLTMTVYKPCTSLCIIANPNTLAFMTWCSHDWSDANIVVTPSDPFDDVLCTLTHKSHERRVFIRLTLFSVARAPCFFGPRGLGAGRGQEEAHNRGRKSLMILSCYYPGTFETPIRLDRRPRAHVSWPKMCRSLKHWKHSVSRYRERMSSFIHSARSSSRV